MGVFGWSLCGARCHCEESRFIWTTWQSYEPEPVNALLILSEQFLLNQYFLPAGTFTQTPGAEEQEMRRTRNDKVAEIPCQARNDFSIYSMTWIFFFLDISLSILGQTVAGICKMLFRHAGKPATIGCRADLD